MMSRIPRPVALDRVASSAPSPTTGMSGGADAGSSSSSSIRVTFSPDELMVRRRTTPSGSAGVPR